MGFRSMVCDRIRPCAQIPRSADAAAWRGGQLWLLAQGQPRSLVAQRTAAIDQCRTVIRQKQFFQLARGNIQQAYVPTVRQRMPHGAICRGCLFAQALFPVEPAPLIIGHRQPPSFYRKVSQELLYMGQIGLGCSTGPIELSKCRSSIRCPTSKRSRPQTTWVRIFSEPHRPICTISGPTAHTVSGTTRVRNLTKASVLLVPHPAMDKASTAGKAAGRSITCRAPCSLPASP